MKLRDSVSANRPSGSVSQRTSSRPAAARSPSTRSRRELGADLRAQLLAGVEVDRQVEVAHERRVLAAGAQAHLDPLVLAVEQRDVVEVLGIEVGRQLAIEHAQDVAVELRRHPLGVVVGGLEHARVLDQVGAHQQMVARPEQPRDLAQHAAATAGREVADRAAEERHDARPRGRRHAVEVALEVSDHAVHAQPRVLLGERLGAVAHHALGDVYRDVALERALLVQRVQQHARLGGRPGAELDELDRARSAARARPRCPRGSRARRASGSTRAGRRCDRTARRRGRRRSASGAAP